MMNKTTKGHILFAAIFTVVVLWQMLLPGYVLTLDMVFTPHIGLEFGVRGFFNDAPVQLVFWLVNMLLSGWIVQKLFLVALFFFLAFLALRFLPVPKDRYANYWAALFYGLNPFVYERFLAGHVHFLFAYAFLPPFIHYLLGSLKDPSYRKVGWLLFWILMIGAFSMHLLVMTILVVAAAFLAKFATLIKDKKDLLRFGKFAAVLAFGFIAVSSYWLIPLFLNKQAANLDVINRANQLSFKTAGGNGLETAANVLSLYGFWEEGQQWSRYFLSPRDHIVFWSVVLILLAAVIGVGIWRAFKERKKEAAVFAIIALAAFVFSCGQGEGIFNGFNTWLFDHFGFWRGFRDTQKWSALLALSYGYFGGWGFWHLAGGTWQEARGRLKIGETAKKIIIALLFCLPVLYTFTMVGGFARQIHPVWYPSSWDKVKNILDADKGDAKTLVLPWHQYMSLDFNQRIITINPAKDFFGSRTVAGDNMETDTVFTQSTDQENLAIQAIILDGNLTPDEAIDRLKSRKISNILVMNVALRYDYLKYPLLGSNRLFPVFRSEDLTLYKID